MENLERDVIFSTGGTRGIGRGIIAATAREHDLRSFALEAHRFSDPSFPAMSAPSPELTMTPVEIENFGNADAAQVNAAIHAQGKEAMFPHIVAERGVKFFGGVDFRQKGALQRALERRILKMRMDGGSRIIQVVYAAGVAGLNEKVDDMNAVNADAAIEMAEVVAESGLATGNANFLYVSSLAADPNGRRVPGLEEYAASKSRAIEGIKEKWLAGDTNRSVSVLLPGVFDSDMADEIMMSEKAPLEFFAAPLASTDPDNPMMKAVADAILSGRMPDEMKFPRLSR